MLKSKNKSCTFRRGFSPRQKDLLDTHSSPLKTVGYSGKVQDKQIILGIDPGLATTGYGAILHSNSNISCLGYGQITSPSKQPFSQRLEKIYRELRKIINQYQPKVIAVEELFFAKNIKTALKVGHARGVIILTAAMLKVPVQEFTPLQVKQALTGYGRADKNQIQKMVKAILHLKEIPKPDDAADALAVAIICSQTKMFIND